MTGPRIVIVTFPSAQILDVTGPLEVFSSATRFLPNVVYRTQVVSSGGGPVLATCGLEFSTTPISGVHAPIDTLVVAGGRDMDEAAADDELLWHIRRLADGARRVTSVCSGASSWPLLDCSTGAAQPRTGQVVCSWTTTTPRSRSTPTPSSSMTATSGPPRG